MPAPMITRRRALYAIHETSPGTLISAASPPLSVVAAYDVDYQPGTPFITREAHYGFGALKGSIGGRMGTLTFKTPIFGTASTGWASLLLPACGMYFSSTLYRFTSLPPAASGSSSKCLSWYFYHDGRLRTLHGSMGNLRLVATAGQPVVAEWTFTGVESTTADTALPTLTVPSALPIRFVSASLTIGSVSPKIAEMTIDLGNEVALREDGNSASGYHSCYIANRRVNGSMSLEADLVANYAPDADFAAGTARALALNFGASGNQVAVAVPDMQISGPPRTVDRGGRSMDVIPWQALRDDQTSIGDDEMTFTLG